MPLSNVFRHSFPNPFHSPSRKSRHTGSTTGSSTSIVVVPVVEGNTSNNNTKKPFFPTFGRKDSRKLLGLRDKGKEKDDGKQRRKGSQATSKSTHSSLSARHLERLDADTIPRVSSPFDLISRLQISKAPPSQEQHMSALSSPTSTSFSPSPLSPQIRMPTSPSAPSTPSVNTSARLLSASPEPLSPLSTSPVSLATTGTIGSRFGSLFTNKSSRRDMEERILPEQGVNATVDKENVDPTAVPKKKRLSPASLQIPIGAFLTNTFRNKQQQGAQQRQQQLSPQQPLQSVQEQEHAQAQEPLQRKKRRGLLPKLPKLDTRPRIISRSGSKKQKEAKQTNVMGHGDEIQAPPELSTVDPAAAPAPGPDVVPGSTATATRRSGGSKSSSLKASPKLLSPFYLPPQIRTGAGSHSAQHLDPNVRLSPPMMATTTGEKNDCPTATTETGSQAAQQLLDVSFNPTLEWHHDSQVFYDDRWDRASVRTVDTEIIRLSDDPNFPGYPERNDYWQQHCRIRERRWKHQIQKHQQQQITDARSSKKWLNGIKANPVTGLAEEDTGSLLLEEDEDYDDDDRITDHDGPLADRLRDVTNLLNSLPETTARHTRGSTAPQSSHQDRFRQRRVRYTTYSAYIAAMQVKSKNRTDHKRSLHVAAMASPTGSDTDKLMADVRALRERSMTQPTNVEETADKFGGPVMSETDRLHSQRRHTYRREGINLGSSDDESEDQYEAEDRVHPMSSFNTLQRQRQPDSGILFVAAAATTAEVYPTLVHDPREHQRQQLLHSKHTRSPDGHSGPEKDDLAAGNINNHTNDENSNDDINSNKNSNDNNNSSTYSSNDYANNNNNNNNNNKKKKDLCLSRPGQYASHNHIMPLEQLLELEEQERQRRRRLLLQQQELDRQQKLMMMEQQQQQVSIYPDPTTKPSTVTTTSLPSSTASTSQTTPSSSLLLPSASTTTTTQSSSSSSSPQPMVGGAGSSRGDTFLTDPSTAISGPSPSSSSTSTPTSLQQQPTDSELTSPTQTQQPQRQSSGYMLLVLDQGRCQYYENGTRKRGPQWDLYAEQRVPKDTSSNGDGYDTTEAIEEGEKEVDEEGLAWMAQQKQRQEFSPYLKRKSAGSREASRGHLLDEQLGQEQQGTSQEVDPLGSLAVIDSPLSPRFAAVLSESPTVSVKSSQVFSAHPSRSTTPNSVSALAPCPQSVVMASSIASSTNANQPARLASSNGLSTLSQIRAVKSRASLSYSVLPTLSTLSYTSSNVLTAAASGSSSASTSTSTLLSSVPSTLLSNPSLKHRTSGSMTPSSTLYSGGGGATLTMPSSPLATSASGATSSSSMVFPGRKLSWSDLPSKPTSTASALLLNALHKPAPSSTTPHDGTSTTTKSLTRTGTRNNPAQRLKQQWDQKMRSQSVMFMSPSTMAARSRSMLLSPPPMTISGSKLWMRTSVHLLTPPPPPSAEAANKNQTQRRPSALSESDFDSQHIETEADQEMEEELLRQLLDDATTDDPQYRHPNKNKHKKNSSGGSGRSLGNLLGVPSVGVEARKAKRALSMVELSASTSALQYKAAVAAVLPAGRTRERYKAEASVSFSTMATLASEGMYQWSEFFDV